LLMRMRSSRLSRLGCGARRSASGRLSAGCQQQDLMTPRGPSRARARPRRSPAVWRCAGRSC